jgi:glycosyltransferase involved in cell wall biosynthesis
MKILIVISSLKVGGAEKQAVIDANELFAYNHDVTVAYGLDGPLSRLIHSEIRKLHFNTDNKLIASFNLFRHLLNNRYDIIHSHMFWAEKIAIVPSKLIRTKIILNEHGLGLWKKWYHKLEMRLVSNYSVCVACSCSLNSQIRKINKEVHYSKLVTLLNSNEKNCYKRISPSNWRSRKIGFVGRFHKVKQLDHFILLAKELIRTGINNFEFILVGEGGEFNYIRETISSEGLDCYFKLTGYQENTEKYLSKMCLFILPSRIEALSVALIEAQSYGIPCITYNVGGNKEVVIHEKTGYIVPPDDTGLLAEHIKYLLHHYEVWEKMSREAHQNANTVFSKRVRLNRLLEIYRK